MPLQLTVAKEGGGTPFSISVDGGDLTLGRAASCDVRIPYQTVSSRHLRLREHGSNWLVTDIGSTNGTLLDGRRLQPGQDVAIFNGMQLRIVDVLLTFDLGQTYDEGFTLAESGTMVRQMVADALQGEHEDDDLAYFEIMSGPGAGRRFPLPEDLADGSIGNNPEDFIFLEGSALSGRVGRVIAEGDTFAVEAAEGANVQLNGVQLQGRQTLATGDRLVVGDYELRFEDPLELYLSELDEEGDDENFELSDDSPSEHAEAPSHEAASDTGTGEIPVEPRRDEQTTAERKPETQEPASRGGFGMVEIVLLVGSVFVLLAGIALALVFLEVI